MMNVREFRAGDEAALFKVFYSAVYQVASRDYSPEQIQAWAKHFGFHIVEKRFPVLRGVVIPNALMRKRLGPHA